jgi:hypothetical protein
VGFQPNDPGDHPFDGPGIQIPAAAPQRSRRFRFRWFLSRGVKYFESFRRVVPPVEAHSSESCRSGRRTERSAIFPGAKCRHDSIRQPYGLEIARPDSGSKQDPRLFRFKRSDLLILILQRPKVGKDYHSLIPSRSRVSRREHKVQFRFLCW